MRVATTLGILLLGACAAGPEPDGAGGTRLVLTTFQPLYSFAVKVAAGSGGIEVVNLAPRELGPHDFDLDDPAHAARSKALVRRADAVVTLRSLALAEHFDQLYPWCRRENVRIVEIDPAVTWSRNTPRLPLVANPEDSARAKGGETPPNPHIWLSLGHSVRLVEAIADDFSALDPERAALYRKNAAAYQNELRRLKAEVEGRFARVENLSVVSLTEGFPYLTADFAIDVADYILEAENPEEVERRVRASGAKIVIAESIPEREVVRAVRRAGGLVVVLTTIEEGWGKGETLDPDGYLEAMRDNLGALANAFGG